MANTLTDIMTVILVQQISHISSAQDRYQLTGRSEDAEIITELMSGLSILPETISCMNELGVSNIDVESIRVFMNKLDLENNLNKSDEETV